MEDKLKVDNKFGGKWTKIKLQKLKGYLEAYGKIFSNNPSAAYFNTYYVDAFAGSGYRTDSKAGDKDPDFFDQHDANDLINFADGSARVALSVQCPLKNYVFIEKDVERAKGLENLKNDYPKHADKIQIIIGDANQKLVEWCRSRDWRRDRAVVFLDPYGMQMEWSTIECLGQTKGVDLWLLFPFGIGVRRLLTRHGNIPEAWQKRLDTLFGSQDWRQRFYRPTGQGSLFDEDDKVVDASRENIAKYLVERLQTVFYRVHPNPYPLYNDNNNPLYLLAFAAGNEKGSKPALNIASHLLKNE